MDRAQWDEFAKWIDPKVIRGEIRTLAGNDITMRQAKDIYLDFLECEIGEAMERSVGKIMDRDGGTE